MLLDQPHYQVLGINRLLLRGQKEKSAIPRRNLPEHCPVPANLDICTALRLVRKVNPSNCRRAAGPLLVRLLSGQTHALLRFLPEETNINFVGVRYVAFAIDGLLLLASILSIAIHGFNLGIDFTGGVLMEVKSAQTIDIGKMRSEVDGPRLQGEPRSSISAAAAATCRVNSCIPIRVQPQSDEANRARQSAARRSRRPAWRWELHRSATPTWWARSVSAGSCSMPASWQRRWRSWRSRCWVAFRGFEWCAGSAPARRPGIDVLVTAGLFSILHLDFTLTSIAALLTLAGYSINDTVVVFDRIRENRRKYKRTSLPELINLSTNQMLTRTILTSVATSTSIIPLLIYGGPALFDFSASILFGIAVGTFSSIYVAAMLLLYLPAPAAQHAIDGQTQAVRRA